MATRSNPPSPSAIRTPDATEPATRIATLNPVDWIALLLMIVGSVNWGLVGLMNLDGVAMIFGGGTPASRIVYSLVGLAGLWGIVLAARLGRGTDR